MPCIQCCRLWVLQHSLLTVFIQLILDFLLLSQKSYFKKCTCKSRECLDIFVPRIPQSRVNDPFSSYWTPGGRQKGPIK